MTHQRIPTLVLAYLLLTLSSICHATLPDGYLSYRVPLDASPAGLAFDADQLLYALEAAPFGSNVATIRVIQPDNTISQSFSIVGDDPTNFFVGGMTYDPIGDQLLVTDNTADGRIYTVSKSGDQQTLATGIPAIADIAVRPTGEIFVSTALGDNVGEVLQIQRSDGNTTTVVNGLDFGAGLAFQPSGNLLVMEADATTFAGRLHELPITTGPTGLEFDPLSLVAENLLSSFGVALDSEGEIFTTGFGGVYSLTGSPATESSFDLQSGLFSTALAFAPGTQPFEPSAGADAGRLAFSSNYDAPYVTLIRPQPPIDADFDNNLHVDGSDLASWQTNFGAITTATNGQGDTDGDYDVDGGDFLNWQRQLSVPETNSVLQTVPEPTTIILMGWLAVLLTGRPFATRATADVRRRQRA